ncbi:MAG: DUF2155 domain-containing protein [Alphaproteobacteria bacterium]
MNRLTWSRGMRSALAALPAIAIAVLAPAAPEAANEFDTEIALLGGLDKVTARVSEFEAPIGEDTRFGSLRLRVERCLKRPPEEPPESAAFLVIEDVRPGEPAVRLFEGWMFASSPALSALEHPVYDVWVIECRKPASKPWGSSAGKAAARASALPKSW